MAYFDSKFLSLDWFLNFIDLICKIDVSYGFPDPLLEVMALEVEIYWLYIYFLYPLAEVNEAGCKFSRIFSNVGEEVEGFIVGNGSQNSWS